MKKKGKGGLFLGKEKENDWVAFCEKLKGGGIKS